MRFEHDSRPIATWVEANERRSLPRSYGASPTLGMLPLSTGVDTASLRQYRDVSAGVSVVGGDKADTAMQMLLVVELPTLMITIPKSVGSITGGTRCTGRMSSSASQ